MASPIGHSLVGYIIAAFSLRTPITKNIRRTSLFVFIANAPDLDFLPGILIGKPNLFHHGISHSIGFGLITSLILVLFFHLKSKTGLIRAFFLYFVLYCSHLILDYLSVDGRTPIGIPLFWPFNNDYFIALHPVLPFFKHSSLDDASIGQMLADIFSIHNLKVIFIELVIILPGIMLYMIINRYRGKTSSSDE